MRIAIDLFTQSLKQEVESDDFIFSFDFFGRIVQAVQDGAGFNLELCRNGDNKVIWFCWRVWEKVEPDRDTIKWIEYAQPYIKRNWEISDKVPRGT